MYDASQETTTPPRGNTSRRWEKRSTRVWKAPPSSRRTIHALSCAMPQSTGGADALLSPRRR
eukprot:8255740-Alexandrium_andersonii.AAC.1